MKLLTRRTLAAATVALGGRALFPSGTVLASPCAGHAPRLSPSEVRATSVPCDDPTIVLPWTNLALDLITIHRPNPVRVGRALALLHVALHDALVIAGNARTSSPRAIPLLIEANAFSLRRAAKQTGAIPNERAAVASAASIVLPYLFPNEPSARFSALVAEATSAEFASRREIEAGQAIGAAVGQRVVARGLLDGADAAPGGFERPASPGVWQPTPPDFAPQPVEPLAGRWQTWVLPNAQVYRPAPPPPYRSPAWRAEMNAVQEAVAYRTEQQAAAVHFWAGGAGTVTPGGLWVEIARELIVRDQLDALQAARTLALTSIAMADAFLCCWDAKYAYWLLRPITADPTLDVLIPTPPFPSYTSGHSTISAAAATVLGHLFPRDAAKLETMALEAKNSRLWAGIHYPIDNDMGALGGGMVGRMVVSFGGKQSEDAGGGLG
jgi:hypothetical protein